MLCACGGLYDKEYETVEDYVFQSQDYSYSDDEVSVKTLYDLKKALLSFVENGIEDGSVIFAEDYPGECTEDMADACWQVRSQNALCAYCVDNISYDINQIVSYYRASVHITYAETNCERADIIKLPYSSGIRELLGSAISELKQDLAVLVSSSSLTSADIEDLIYAYYDEHPETVPVCPKAEVTLFSGSNSQKLYEIRFRYGMEPDELSEKKKVMQDALRFEPAVRAMSEYEKALFAEEQILEELTMVPTGDESSVYDALIAKESDPHGVALAYVAVCRALGLDCMAVHGQCNRTDYTWNLVKIDGVWYHAVLQSGAGYGSFRNDEEMWMNYRWDTSNYPVCESTLTLD